MRALVTGAAGFIGSSLVDRLLADGHQVIGIDNFCTGLTANLDHAFSCTESSPRQFTFVQGDILAPELSDIVAGAGPQVIFHLAAQVDQDTAVADPQFDARCNVLGTINLCEASRRAGVRRIVYAASGESRYGAGSPLVDESNRVDPRSPLAVAKLAGELYLRAYAEMYDLAPICLALASVYGPRQHPHGAGGVIAGLGHAMVTGRPYVVYRDGAVTHDYVYVDDAVDAFMCAASAPLETTGTFNIGNGRHVTLTEIHGLMSGILDGPSPSGFAVDAGAESHAIALEATKAKNELGWHPTVDLEEGVRRTLRWLSATLQQEPPELLPA